jgi:hypothetical protein
VKSEGFSELTVHPASRHLVPSSAAESDEHPAKATRRTVRTDAAVTVLTQRAMVTSTRPRTLRPRTRAMFV